MRATTEVKGKRHVIREHQIKGLMYKEIDSTATNKERRLQGN